MRLSESQIAAGLEHPNVFVRDTVFDYFEDSTRTHVDITRAAIAAVDRYGWENAFLWPHRIASFELDEPSLLWALDQIECMDQDAPSVRMPSHLTRMVRQAPVDVLRPHLDRILALDAFHHKVPSLLGSERTPAELLHRRLAVWEHDAAQCWEVLHEHCELVGDVENFDDANVPYGELLVERIAADGALFGPLIQAVLEDGEIELTGVAQWRIGFMIVLAGQLRLEATIPHLLRYFETDWDWYNEQIMYSLVQIGTESAIRYAAEAYTTQPWYVRNYLTSVFENVHHDHAVDYILPLVEKEDDDHLRGQLGVAIASQFDDDGIAPARDLYLESPLDYERDTIIERLFAHSHLAEIDLPERDEWGRQIEERWNDLQQSVGDSGEFLTELANRLVQEKQKPLPIDVKPLLSQPTFNRTDATIHRAQRVGRNDPCPCGSGKKYKKCCLRTAVG